MSKGFKITLYIIFGAVLLLYIFGILTSDYEWGRDQRMRDVEHRTQLMSVQRILYSFNIDNNSYPKNLTELSPKYTNQKSFFGQPYVVDTDNLYYSVHTSSGGKYDGYHLGIDLEKYLYGEIPSPFLKDSDCNSIDGLNCPFKSGYVSETAFDGSDASGCDGGKGRFCLDVTEKSSLDPI